MSKYDELEKLNTLKEQGAISEGEYEREKARLLAEPISVENPPSANLNPFRPWGMTVSTYCMLIHLSQLISLLLPPAGWVVPVVMWAIFKDQDLSIDQHGRVVINWILSSLVYTILCVILAFVIIGIPLLIALFVTGLIFAIMGGIKANDGYLWVYPLSITFLPVSEDNLPNRSPL